MPRLFAYISHRRMYNRFLFGITSKNKLKFARQFVKNYGYKIELKIKILC